MVAKPYHLYVSSHYVRSVVRVTSIIERDVCTHEVVTGDDATDRGRE